MNRIQQSKVVRFWPLVPALALALAGCSSFGGGAPAPAASGGATGSASGSVADRAGGWLFGRAARPGEGLTEPELPDCPAIDVRQGASTMVVYGAGERNATNVRWQATVGDTARECALAGGTMTVKVGMQGRIIIGPAGGAGRLDVPVRFALVHEGPEPKTIWTKFYKIPVDIPAGQPNVSFVHVEDALTFPRPPGDALEAYVIYVGFDQTAKEQPAPRGRRPKAAAR